jgi:lipoprotein-anchoring transpeptidase ErfK/SrfK
VGGELGRHAAAQSAITGPSGNILARILRRPATLVSMRSPGRARRLAAITAFLLVVLAVVAVGAIAYDDAREDTIAKGVRVGGVDVGGMRVTRAREVLTEKAVRPLRRTVEVSAGSRTFLLSTREAKLTVDVEAAVDRALAVSRRGWLGARVVRGLTGKRTDAEVPLARHVDSGAVARFARHTGKEVERTPVSAAVEPHPDALSITHARSGRTLDTVALRRRIRRTLVDPRRSVAIKAELHAVAPDTTTTELRKKYPAYILIDRGAHQLRLYKDLALDRTFPIAVGKQGLETPAGLYDVQWKEENPIWRVPNSDWAGDLAGKNIPPGPDNPIKARWLAFNGAAGIHGIDPSEYGSIGHDASHGCVRMRIPDVIQVYDAAPVGTPVFVA